MSACACVYVSGVVHTCVIYAHMSERVAMHTLVEIKGGCECPAL